MKRHPPTPALGRARARAEATRPWSRAHISNSMASPGTQGPPGSQAKRPEPDSSLLTQQGKALMQVCGAGAQVRTATPTIPVLLGTNPPCFPRTRCDTLGNLLLSFFKNCFLLGTSRP